MSGWRAWSRRALFWRRRNRKAFELLVSNWNERLKSSGKPSRTVFEEGEIGKHSSFWSQIEKCRKGRIKFPIVHTSKTHDSLTHETPPSSETTARYVHIIIIIIIEHDDDKSCNNNLWMIAHKRASLIPSLSTEWWGILILWSKWNLCQRSSPYSCRWRRCMCMPFRQRK